MFVVLITEEISTIKIAVYKLVLMTLMVTSTSNKISYSLMDGSCVLELIHHRTNSFLQQATLRLNPKGTIY